VSGENIRRALVFPEYEGPREDNGNRRIVLGFDHKGNLPEIFYNQLDERTAKVFHAMKCRSIFYHLLNRQENMMPDMTGEEYDALDEYYTKNPPKVDPAARGGMFTRRRELPDSLDQVAAGYIRTRAEADHKLPIQIIGEPVREKISHTT
jgi:hypothetical protein